MKNIGNFESHYLYSTYKSMKARCYNKNRGDYHRYGGRGIKVCHRWKKERGFINFVEDMGDRPEGSTLERKDNNGDYSPSNCIWADKITQANNCENNLAIEYKGNTYTEAEICREFNMNRSTFQTRRLMGLSVENCLSKEDFRKVFVEYEGEKISPKELSNITGTKVATIRYRIRQGWSNKEIINGR